MLLMNATEVRKNWSSVVDFVVRERPAFIKRTRDTMMFSDLTLVENLLLAYQFTAETNKEEDGSVTLALCEIDLIENGADEPGAKRKLAAALLEYAEDYYNEFNLWSNAPNRKAHVPYVIKCLILNDIDKIGALIKCRPGES